MSLIDTIRKLEDKACESETKIALLKKEITEINSLINAIQKAKVIAKLSSDSEGLEEEVLKSKQELIELQKRSESNEYFLPSAYVPTSTRLPRTTRNISEVGGDFGRLDLRVGKIFQVDFHPNASHLYVSKIEVNNTVLNVISGLVRHIHPCDLFLRPVIVVCNLKPVTIRGIVSQGMLLCAMGNGAIETLWPPYGSKPGTRVVAGSYEYHPDKVFKATDSVFKSILNDLSINGDKELMFQKDIPVIVEGKGPIFTRNLVNCSVV